MKKLFSILLLTLLFISCSSDDDNDPDDGSKNGKDIVDQKIVGKWKVEYSKSIKPAGYVDGKLTWDEDSKITEYEGNWGEINVVPKSGMFDTKEIRIEIKEDITIISSIGGGNPKTTVCLNIKDGYITRQSNLSNDPMKYKYYFEGDILIIEVLTPYWISDTYIISKYSKIVG